MKYHGTEYINEHAAQLAAIDDWMTRRGRIRPVAAAAHWLAETDGVSVELERAIEREGWTPPRGFDDLDELREVLGDLTREDLRGLLEEWAEDQLDSDSGPVAAELLVEAAGAETPGPIIRRARETAGLGRVEMGERLGLPVQEDQRTCRTLVHWEREERDPNWENRRKIRALADEIAPDAEEAARLIKAQLDSSRGPDDPQELIAWLEERGGEVDLPRDAQAVPLVWISLTDDGSIRIDGPRGHAVVEYVAMEGWSTHGSGRMW